MKSINCRQKDVARLLRKQKALIKYKLKMPKKIKNKSGGQFMKKGIFVLLFCFMFSMTDLAYSQQFKKYKVTQANFEYTIRYPSNWKIINIEGALQLFAPTNFSDNFKPNIVILVTDLNSIKRNFEEFQDLWGKTISAELSDFKLIEKGKTLIDGKMAFYYIYTGEKDKKKFRYKSYSIKNANFVYELIYEDRDETFDFNLDLAEVIMQSIKIVK
ncbi:MAG: hypothetical protein NC918_01410 [Candidatus Omnitrophica bacterium]|nr:hypothetical protein [Candidatus Omnitrophota bacterium]